VVPRCGIWLASAVALQVLAISGQELVVGVSVPVAVALFAAAAAWKQQVRPEDRADRAVEQMLKADLRSLAQTLNTLKERRGLESAGNDDAIWGHIASLQLGPMENEDDRRRLAGCLSDDAWTKCHDARAKLQLLAQLVAEYQSDASKERPDKKYVGRVATAVEDAVSAFTGHQRTQRAWRGLVAAGPFALMFVAIGGIVVSVAWAAGAFDPDDPSRRSLTSAAVAGAVSNTLPGAELVHCRPEVALHWTCTVQQTSCQETPLISWCDDWAVKETLVVRALSAAEDPKLCPAHTTTIGGPPITATTTAETTTPPTTAIPGVQTRTAPGDSAKPQPSQSPGRPIGLEILEGPSAFPGNKPAKATDKEPKMKKALKCIFKRK
jgi:hypothetical protein